MAENDLPVLAVVEGLHDTAFLKRISRLLHRHDRNLPNLTEEQALGRVVFLPVGGNGPQAWLDRLAALGKPEFFLFDREIHPETEIRQRALAAMKPRRNRIVCLTRKRSLENYLHPAAIEAVCGVMIAVDDDKSIADEVARQLFEEKRYKNAWNQITPRTQKRLREQAKRWLNREVVDRMKLEWLHERDSNGEVRGWMQAIAKLLACQ